MVFYALYTIYFVGVFPTSKVAAKYFITKPASIASKLAGLVSLASAGRRYILLKI
jgi:amino acid transporter